MYGWAHKKSLEGAMDTFFQSGIFKVKQVSYQKPSQVIVSINGLISVILKLTAA